MSMAALLLDFMKYERISISIASCTCGTFLCKPMIGICSSFYCVLCSSSGTRYSQVAFECSCMYGASIVLISVV